MKDLRIIWKLFLILFIPPFISSSSPNHPKTKSAQYILTKYFDEHQHFDEYSFQRYLSSFPHCEPPIPSLSIAHRELVAEGYHRDLFSTFKLTNHSNSCKSILIEILPPSIFADPFELHRRRDSHDVFVAGDTNLELPAFLSNRTLVEIHTNIDHSEEIELRVPVHARYAPLEEEGCYVAEFGPPILLVNCSDGKLRHSLCIGKTQFGGHVMWKIPSGKPSHSNLVSIVTFFSSFAAAFAIVYVSLKRRC